MEVNQTEQRVKIRNDQENGMATVDFSDTAPYDISHSLLYDDCCQLNLLHEAPLLNLLKSRFEHKVTTNIYTWCGDVLICLNPYKYIPHEYDIPGKIEEEHNSQLKKPHPYAVASKVLETLSTNGRGQSIIVNGESGAGKTEAVKSMMKYLSNASRLIDENVKTVEKQMMNSNPLLEAFGNAKTVRNNNSSRFGKYQKLLFNKNRAMVGGNISHFLLEKGRVIQQNNGERNYHIFYQLCDYASEELKRELCLTKHSSKYRILNFANQANKNKHKTTPTKKKIKKAKAINVEHSEIDDSKGFQEVLNAFKHLNIDDEERNEIFKVLSIILHLGELAFISNDDDNNNDDNTSPSCKIENREILDIITTKLLKNETSVNSNNNDEEGISSLKLEQVLTSRTWNSGRQNRSSMVAVPLTVDQAIDSCDAMAKVLYEKIFDFIVTKCNLAMTVKNDGDDGISIVNSVTTGIYNFFTGGNDDNGSLGAKAFIGMLDIQGFELLEINRLEQLCINYANEMLQGLFIHHLFDLEYQLYEAEGITYEKVDFKDNKKCIDLLVKKPVGIFHLLDETSMLLGSKQKVDDYTFLNKVHACHLNKNENFVKPKFKSTTFQIKHFAGVVAYNCNGFLLSNADPLNVDCINLLTAGGTLSPSENSTSNTSTFLSNLFSSFQASTEISSRLTISRNFRSQLKDLNKELSETDLHFVRCIKPNDLRFPLAFDSEKVLRQLKYGGIIDYIGLRNKGFPVRMAYAKFKDTYQTLNMIKNVPEKSYQKGKTMLFMRSGVIEFLDHLVYEKKQKAIILIQNAARKKLAKNKFNFLKEIHERALAEQGRKKALKLKFKRYAKTVIIKRRRDMLRELIRYGGAKDELEKLHAAAKLGEISTIMKLISEDHELAHKTFGKNDKTLLISAIESENENTVGAVLRMNPLSINTSDKDGLTPLHYCAKIGNITLAKLVMNTSNKQFWEHRKAKMAVNRAIVYVNNNKYRATVVGLNNRKNYGTATSNYDDGRDMMQMQNMTDRVVPNISFNTMNEPIMPTLRKTKSQRKGKLMEGWLMKRRDISLWKRRWVELTPNSLRYYKKNKVLNLLDRKKKGRATVIDLRVAMLAMDKDYKHSFVIVSPHLLDAESNPQGRLHFKCQDDEELNRWVSVLRNLSHVGFDASLHVVNREIMPHFWDDQCSVANALTNANESPLYMCAKCARGVNGAKTIAWLVEQGADIDVQNKMENDKTPLHVAIAWKNYDVAKILLRRGANPKLKDSDGKTALSYCSPDDIDAITVALENDEKDTTEHVDPGIIAQTLNLSQILFSDIKKFTKETGKKFKKGKLYRKVQSRPTMLLNADDDQMGMNEDTEEKVNQKSDTEKNLEKLLNYYDRSSLLSRREPSFSDSYLSVYIEKIGGENLHSLNSPFISISLIKYTTKSASSHERIQVTDLPLIRDREKLFFFCTYNMQTPLEQIGDDAALILELRAFDQHTGRPKTIIWTKQQLLNNRKLTFFSSPYCLQGYFPPVDKSATAERQTWLTSKSSNSFFSGIFKLHTLKL